MKNILGALLLAILMACNNTAKLNEVNDSAAIDIAKAQISTVVFKDEKLQTIFNEYISLKNALASSKVIEAQSAAKLLANNLNTYNGCENTALIANKIENTKDIVAQRKNFTTLSSDVIAMFKHADLKSGTIFIQHCPMANKGEGGDWLAVEKKIQNPYYGSEMMECGAVIEEIATKK
jgi:hypothetical protein